MMKRAVKLLLSVAAVVCLAVFLLKIPSLTTQLFPPKEKAKPKPTEHYTNKYSGSVVRRDLNNLVETSHLIAIGEVMDEPESFCVRCVGGGDQILSDQTVRIEQVFMGAEDKETVTVRQAGGTIGLRTEQYIDNPVLHADRRYLLFLYQPDMGGGYNTEGDYYYIRGLTQGVYEVMSDGTYRQSYGPTLSETDLTDAISNRTGAPYSSRAEYLANQEHNYRNGQITKDHYEKNIALVDEYAVIIPDTEASWY